MSGHGHVIPNPDGSKARCGGPPICRVCARETLRATPEHYAPVDDQLLADYPELEALIEARSVQLAADLVAADREWGVNDV